MNNKLVLIFSFLLLAAGLCSAKGTKTLYVADRRVACAGTFECMQIREKSNGPWRNYSDTIAGFKYQEGYEYKIKVEQLQTENTLSGMYEEKYKLVKVISKVKTGYNPGVKLEGKSWILKKMNDTFRTLNVTDSTIFVAFDAKTGKTHGKVLCNTFASSFTCDGTNIAFTDMAATKALCKGEVFEQIIFSFYEKSKIYKLQGNLFTIYEPDGSYLQFEGR